MRKLFIKLAKMIKKYYEMGSTISFKYTDKGINVNISKFYKIEWLSKKYLL